MMQQMYRACMLLLVCQQQLRQGVPASYKSPAKQHQSYSQHLLH